MLYKQAVFYKRAFLYTRDLLDLRAFHYVWASFLCAYYRFFTYLVLPAGRVAPSGVFCGFLQTLLRPPAGRLGVFCGQIPYKKCSSQNGPEKLKSRIQPILGLGSRSEVRNCGQTLLRPPASLLWVIGGQIPYKKCQSHNGPEKLKSR